MDRETINDTEMYSRNEGTWNHVLDEPPALALTNPKYPAPALQSGDKRPAPCRTRPISEASPGPDPVASQLTVICFAQGNMTTQPKAQDQPHAALRWEWMHLLTPYQCKI